MGTGFAVVFSHLSTLALASEEMVVILGPATTVPDFLISEQDFSEVK